MTRRGTLFRRRDDVLAVRGEGAVIVMGQENYHRLPSMALVKNQLKMLSAHILPAEHVALFERIAGYCLAELPVRQNSKQQAAKVFLAIEQKTCFSIPDYVLRNPDIPGQDHSTEQKRLYDTMTECFGNGWHDRKLALQIDIKHSGAINEP